jgi:hypothetical protein
VLALGEEKIPIDNLTTDYSMLLETQQAIGQDSIFSGFFAPTWTILQRRYLQSVGLPHDKHQASRSMKALTIEILTHCHTTVWLLRNSHLHVTDPYKHLHILAQIQEL